MDIQAYFSSIANQLKQADALRNALQMAIEKHQPNALVTQQQIRIHLQQYVQSVRFVTHVFSYGELTPEPTVNVVENIDVSNQPKLEIA